MEVRTEKDWFEEKIIDIASEIEEIILTQEGGSYQFTNDIIQEYTNDFSLALNNFIDKCQKLEMQKWDEEKIPQGKEKEKEKEKNILKIVEKENNDNKKSIKSNDPKNLSIIQKFDKR